MIIEELMQIQNSMNNMFLRERKCNKNILEGGRKCNNKNECYNIEIKSGE